MRYRSVIRLAASLLVISTLSLSLVPLAVAQKQAPKSPTASPDRLAELEQQVKRLQSRINDLTSRTPYNSASLDCNSKKYVEFRLEESFLVFFASCQSIEPYLEGHKVLLRIGNPYSFNFSNVKGRLQYGKTLAEAVNQQSDISLVETFRGGAWLPLTIIINPSKAEDLRELWLELRAETTGATR